jgi:NAD(P)H-dependent FMN reductase
MDLLIAALSAAVLVSPARESGREPVLRSIRVGAEAGASIVVIEADGPLPLPSVGVLGRPPRIYLDFPDVIPSTHGTAAELDPLVLRVRVALHQRLPVVTRVVIDLTKTAPHRVEAGGRERGRLTVVVGPSAGAASQATRARPPRARSVDPGGEAIAAALSRLERLRPLLLAIDARLDVPAEALRAGISEWEAIRQTLALVRPRAAVASTHETLTKVCVLGSTAANTRLDAQQDSDAARAWNAASAAAGALILLDRTASALTMPLVAK